MNDVTDTEYFSDTNVRITRSRAIFEDKMYPMASIASVGMITTPGVDTRTVSKISGSIILVLALGAAIWVSTIGFEFVRVVLYAGAASVAAVGFFIFVSGENIPEQYTLVLVNASGESKVLVSVEKRYIEKVISAINTAIVHRG